MAKKKRSAKRSYDPEATRAQLLDVAASAFQRSGYHGVAIQDIMGEAGVTSGALYHHFDSKKALGLAVVRERAAKVIAEAWIHPVQHAEGSVAGIRRVFKSIIANIGAGSVIKGCPLNNMAIELSISDADFRAAAREVFDAWRRGLAQSVSRDMAAGRIKADTDPEAVAAFVIAVFEGAMSLAKCDQDKSALKQCARQLDAYLLGLENRA